MIDQCKRFNMGIYSTLILIISCVIIQCSAKDIRTCKALPVPNDIEVQCERDGQQVNCTGPQLVGTRVHPKCAPFFLPRVEPYYKFITCQNNGSWDQTIFSCVSKCGIQSLDPSHLDGKEVTLYGDTPWNVAIYRKRKNGPFLICSGTLVHPQIVVSAAHCFYDTIKLAADNNTEDYEIFVKKMKRDYKENELKYKIKKFVFSQRGYNPQPAYANAYDIILLVLEKPVKLGPYVLPACLSLTEHSGFIPVGRNNETVLGKVSGWGLDDDDKPREMIRTIDIPYVPYDKCVSDQVNITPDKFCAGFQKGPGIRAGDSGAGLLFPNPQNGLYYLRGVVSYKYRLSNSSISTFTDISYYIDWIDEVRNQLNKEK